ncbi:HAD family hydrolase [uncultured Clostridium sp.]|uniref:HAD family hydrolase n=1 Tax=uncultured Clostridium sp. TaxID=59620 RepID=UPI0028EE02D4|nr:HAD family hydrolase [uncultured Clostridium sp.]
MIFASDLDRTLIYSNFFLEPHMINVIPVERKDDKNISHMTINSIKLLSLINEKLLFIPTTTRSLEQYKRISIFHETIPVKYAVVANGGIILKNGEIDLKWKEIISSKMKTLISPKDLIKLCSFFLDSNYIKSYRCCDDLFLYAVLKSDFINSEDFHRLVSLANEHGYIATRNNKKVYIIPKFINKWAPLEYIMTIENENQIISAGDSFLDLPMLHNSMYGIVPFHGELQNLYKDKLAMHDNIYFTKEQGLLSSEEFLKNILKLVS